MKEQLVTYETAKIAKEKGFKDYSRSGWHYDGNGYLDNTNELTTWNDHPASSFMCDAPTQSLLQKWLREEHGIHIVLIPTVTSSWTYKSINVLSKKDNDIILGIKNVSQEPPYTEVSGFDFSSYEQALEEGLQEALTLI